jgi:hypothetical protein
MKNTVILDEFREVELKPSELVGRYLTMVEDDVRRLWSDQTKLKDVACPGCASKDSRSTFVKLGLTYKECAKCRSVYVSLRPSEEELRSFHIESPSRKFWNKELYQTTVNKRKEKIIKPRGQWVLDSTTEYRPKASTLADINAIQHGDAEQMKAANFFKSLVFIDPYTDIASSIGRDQVKIESLPWWKADTKHIDVVTLFEVIERTGDVSGLFQKLHGMLNPGGLCFITTVLAGFDIQVLWDKARNLFPPDRLNVLTVEGLQTLINANGFECLELSTPGVLDINIVEQALRDNPDIKVDRFVEQMLRRNNNEAKRAFQEFLQMNLLSSHGRILIRKK